MKKLLFAASTIASLLSPAKALAADIVIQQPEKGFADLGKFINNVIIIAFSIAILLVLVMLVWGAFEWITSGGDKEGVGKARSKIINALIGLAVLAVAFALARLGADFVGINIFSLPVPAPR